MLDDILLGKLNSLLGQGSRTSKGNWAFFCPKCNHYKKKLEINLDYESPYFQNYSCWVCPFKGKNINTLFKKLNSDIRVKGPKKYSSTKAEDQLSVSLPKEFIQVPLIKGKNIVANKALIFLKKRGLSEIDILRYNIGYCSSGEYNNRIIIPSYDSNLNLNFFITRSFEFDNYKNPPISKDVILFESFINWSLPVILCEGPFDAISIKRNSIPLAGKIIQDTLMKRLMSKEVKDIYIALDNDAIKQSLSFCEQLMKEGKEVYFVPLDKKDPSEMGFKDFTKTIQTIQPMTFLKLMSYRLKV